MDYMFNAKNASFYPLVMKEDYEASGTWPADGVLVDEGVFKTYIGQAPPGKMRGADDNGCPAWVDIPPPPPPTHEQRVSSADYQREQWLTKAGLTIGPLQDAVDLDIATEEERARLTEWKQFRVAVYRIDPTLAPDIDWPEPPRGFDLRGF